MNNTPEHIECLHGVPMSGAVFNPINYRLDARQVAFILKHGKAKVFIVDTEFSETAAGALAQLEEHERPHLIVDVDDELCTTRGPRVGTMTFDEFVATGSADFVAEEPFDEWDALALCYTSGTTADPKGVVLHHRGCYLNALNNAMTWSMPRHAVYLWTLPMFHCTGWCFPWTVTALAGTNVCLRKVDPTVIFDLIPRYKVTHLCGAPVVMTALLSYKGPRTWDHQVKMMTAASAPPAPVLLSMQQLGIDITHVYGLTEVFGPVTVCEWKNEQWDGLPIKEQAALKARQGVRYLALEGLMVADPETLKPVPKDGKTMGEVFMRGNLVMKGYLKNPSANEKALAGGWFHTGDLAVWDPDHYIQLKDRSKDLVISGGENISTLEVESLLYAHPKILEAAIVARPDEKWGESVCAFVEVKPGESIGDKELFEWCQANMPKYCVPRTFVFGTLPKTSTGKVQKHVLRDSAKALTKPTMSIQSKLFDAKGPASKL